MFATGISFANNGDGHPKKDVVNVSADGIEVAVITDDTNKDADSDALYCSINCGNGREYSCWFCSCDSLPDCGGAQQQ